LIGQEQLDHQLNKCPKRIIACAVGCIMKASEEVFFIVVFTKYTISLISLSPITVVIIVINFIIINIILIIIITVLGMVKTQI
jgi:hypothetical protein